MAKKEKLQGDNFDFDSELDFNFDDPAEKITKSANPEVMKDSRKPVTKVFKGTIEGAASAIRDPALVGKFAERALPDTYGVVFNRAGEIKEGVTSLYNDAVKEIKPEARALARQVNRLVPERMTRTKGAINKIYQKLGGDEEQGNGNKRNDEINSTLSAIFSAQSEVQTQQQVQQDVKQDIRDNIDKKRFETSANLLDSISQNMQRMASYTERVNAAWQKKMLELTYRQYFVQADSLELQKKYFETFKLQQEAISKNTALPEFVKIKKSEQFKAQSQQKLIDSIQTSLFGDGSYFKKGMGRLKGIVMDKASKASQAFSMAAMGAEQMADAQQMQKEFAEMGMGGGDTGGFSSAIGNMAGRGIIEHLAGKAGGFVNKKYMQNQNNPFVKFGHTAAKYAGDMPGAVQAIRDSKYAEDDGSTVGGIRSKVVNFFTDLFGTNKPDTAMAMGDGLGDLIGPSIGFSGRNSRSLDVVIPGYLARIYREIQVLRTGNTSIALTEFNQKAGKFSVAKKIEADIRSSILAKVNKKAFDSETEKTADMIIGKSNISKEAREALIKKIKANSFTDHLLDSKRIKSDAFLKDLDPKIAEELKKLANENFSEGAEDHGMKDAALARQGRSTKMAIGDPRGLIEQLANIGHSKELEKMGFITKDKAGGKSVNLAKLEEYLKGQEGLVTSDFYAKKDVKKFTPQQAIDGVSKTPVYNWTYKSGKGDEGSHTSPMAQDLQHSFGNDVAPGGKKVDLISMYGINMSALQGLQQSIDEKLSGINADTSAILKLLSSGNLGGSGGGNSATKKRWFDKSIADIGSEAVDMATKMGKGAWDISGKVLSTVRTTGGKAGAAIKKKWEENKDQIYETSGKIFKRGVELAQSVTTTAYNTFNDIIKNKLPAAAKWTKELYTNAKDSLTNYLNRAQDIYVKGRQSPALSAFIMKAGGYKDQVTGVVIKTIKDIKGNVVDAEGNVVLSIDDIKNGIFDKWGKPIKAWSGKISEFATHLAGKAMERGMAIWEGAKTLGKSLKEKWDNRKFLKGGFKLPPGLMTDNNKVLKVLTDIRDFMVKHWGDDDDKKAFNDRDGNGMRDGGWEEQLDGQNKEGKPGQGGFSILGKAAKGIGGAARGLLGSATSAAGGAGSVAGSVAGGLLGGARTLGGKAMGKLGGVGKWLGGKAMGKLGGVGKWLGGKLPVVASAGGSLLGRTLGVGGRVLGGGLGLLGKGAGLLGGAATGLLGNLFGGGQQQEQQETDEQTQQLGQVPVGSPSVKQPAIPAKDRAFNDRDGSGRRDGSWQDRLEKQDADKKEAKLKQAATAGASKRGGGGIMGGIFSAASGAMGSLMDAVGSLSDIFMNTGAGKGLKSLWSKTGGKLLGKLKPGGLFGKAIGAAGRFGIQTAARLGLTTAATSAATSAAGAAATSAATTAATTAATAAGSSAAAGVGAAGATAATGGLGATLMGFASALAMPLAIVGGVALLGYGIYKAVKYLKRNNTSPFSLHRLMQYGLSDKQKNLYCKIFGLEDYLAEKVVEMNGIVPTISESKIDIETVCGIFDVNPKDLDHKNRFIKWYRTRFAPIFLKHLSTIRKFDPKATLRDVESLKPEQKEQYVTSIEFKDGPYDEATLPFKEFREGDVTPDQIAQAFKTLQAFVSKEDKRDAFGGTKTSLSGLTENEKASMRKQYEKAGKPIPDELKPSVPGDKKGKQLDAKGLPINTTQQGPLTALEAVRFKTYGLVSNEPSKVGAIRALERYLYPMLQFDGRGIAGISTHPLDVIKVIGSEFGLGQYDRWSSRWVRWYKDRFLKVFLTWCSLYANATSDKNPKNENRLQPAQALAIAKKLSGMSEPWTIKISPWEGYNVGVDPNLTKDNIAFLEKSVKEKELADQRAKAPPPPKTPDPTKDEVKLPPQLAPQKPQAEKPKTVAKQDGKPGIDEPKPSGGSSSVPNKGAGVNFTPPKVAGGPLADGAGAGAFLGIKNGVEVDGVDSNIWGLFKGMVQEYGEKTGKKVGVNSVFRDRAKQEELYRKDPAHAAKPGGSPHEYGIAIDVDSGPANEMDKLGLMRKYGFTRPVGGETWHIEPAGIQANLTAAKNDLNWRTQAVLASPGKGGGGLGSIKGTAVGRNKNLAMRLWTAEGGEPMKVPEAMPGSMPQKDNQKDADANKDPQSTGVGPIGGQPVKTAKVPKRTGSYGGADQNVSTDEPKPKSGGMTAGGGKQIASFKPSPTGGANAAGVDTNSADQPKTVNDVKKVIDKAAQKTGADVDKMQLFARLESGYNPAARAKTSNAVGLYQFTPATWTEMTNKTGNKYGITVDSPRDDAMNNALMGGELIKRSEKEISPVKRNPSVTDIYLAHFLGPTGARKFLAASPDAAAADVLPNAAKSNKSIFYKQDGSKRTIQEVYALLEAKTTGQSSGQAPNGNQQVNNGQGVGSTPASPMKVPAKKATKTPSNAKPIQQQTSMQDFANGPVGQFGGNSKPTKPEIPSFQLPGGEQTLNDISKTLVTSLDVQTKTLEAIVKLADKLNSNSAPAPVQQSPIQKVNQTEQVTAAAPETKPTAPVISPEFRKPQALPQAPVSMKRATFI